MCPLHSRYTKSHRIADYLSALPASVTSLLREMPKEAFCSANI